MTFPIVLAHGIARFDALGDQILHLDNTPDPHLDCLHYFKCIRTMLGSHGFNVWHSSVPWAAGVQTRAEQLRLNVLDILKKTGAEKVSIIAHSMGGLDTRHMMFNDRNTGRIHEKIAALVTISTPHEGSPASDWMLENLPEVPQILKKLGIAAEGLRDLTSAECSKFNNDPQVQAFENGLAVNVTTYAGQSNLLSTIGVLKPFYMLIKQQQGPNDGLVSLQGAKWRKRDHQGVWNSTDHLNELGHWDLDQIAAGESQDELLARIHRNYLGIAQSLP
jgi:triacylglycerol lipase